jgi:hypothetical protein
LARGLVSAISTDALAFVQYRKFSIAIVFACIDDGGIATGATKRLENRALRGLGLVIAEPLLSG